METPGSNCFRVFSLFRKLLFLCFNCVRAPGADTLVVLAHMPASDFGQLHLHAQVFFRKLYRFRDCEVGIPLAASGAAHGTDGMKRCRSHQIAQTPFFLAQRCRAGDDGDKNAGTDRRAPFCPAAAFHAVPWPDQCRRLYFYRRSKEPRPP